MFPHERSLVNRLADKPFALIGVNGDPNLEQLRSQNEAQKVNWRSFWNGEKGPQGGIPEQWNVQGWPTLYLIDHEGVIRNKWLGSPGDSVLDQEIEKLVAEAMTSD